MGNIASGANTHRYLPIAHGRHVQVSYSISSADTAKLPRTAQIMEHYRRLNLPKLRVYRYCVTLPSTGFAG